MKSAIYTIPPSLCYFYGEKKILKSTVPFMKAKMIEQFSSFPSRFFRLGFVT